MWKSGPVLAVLIYAACILAQDSTYTLKIDVPFVSIDVSVKDQQGRPMGNLTKDDFLIFENGVQKEIRNFSPVDSPYNVLFLFDCSNSTRAQWPFLAAAMSGFFKQVRQQDKIAVALFGSGHRMVQDWTLKRQIELDLQKCPNVAGHGTDVYGALEWAVDQINDVNGRTGVVVLTDGLHNGAAKRTELIDERQISVFVDAKDDGGFQKVLRAIRQSDARFYFVGINTDLNPPGRRDTATSGQYQNQLQMRARMQQVAATSGGRVSFPREPEDVVTLYEEIGRELGTAYSIGYAVTPGNGEYRRIEVRMGDGKAQISQSREGYNSQ